MGKSTDGFVYILANASFRKDWLKIGKTDCIEKRLRTLNTATPHDFEIVAIYHTRDPNGVEHRMHEQMKNLTKSWFEGSEFFLIDRDKAVRALRIVAEDHGEIGGFVEYLGGHEYRRYAPDGKATVQDTPVDERMMKAEFHTKKAGTDIRMKVVGKGVYRVLAGSLLDPPTASFPKTNRKDHERRLAVENAAVDGRSVRDEDFSSPSSAAATFLGRSANGRVDWIDRDGNPLGSYIPEGW